MTKQQIREMKIQVALVWLRDQAASGLGKDDWCDKNGIKRWQFYKWQRVIKNMMLDSIEQNSQPVAPEAGDQNPIFVEIPTDTAVTTTNLAPTDYNLNNNYNLDNSSNAVAPGPAENAYISISCGKFSIKVKSGIDTEFLTTILGAVSNAN